MKPLINILPNFSKVPPQAVDVEEALIGACLLYPDAIFETDVKPEMFYIDAHRKIYQAFIDLGGKGDIVSVTNRLRDKGELEGVGGPVYLSKISSNIYTNSQVSYYGLIIKQKFVRREFIRISAEIQAQSFDESIDLSEVIEYAESSLFHVSNFTQSKEPISLGRCIDEALIEINKIYTKEKSLVGVPSGFTSIDRNTGGWQPGDLIIIAGRPSMGKTAFALEIAKRIAVLKYPACIFSLEMSQFQMAVRSLSGATGYTNVQIRNAEVNMDRLVTLSNNVADLPIYIDDTPSLSLFELRSKVKKVILRYGVKAVFVDYLQLMQCKADSREQEVSQISRGMKAIAKEFNIPVIALSQLNREAETRRDGRPKLSDLRESGAIEQDADTVCFIYRPCKYNIEKVIVDNESIDTANLMLIEGAKNRNGALFSVPLYHNESFTNIVETKEELKENTEQKCDF